MNDKIKDYVLISIFCFIIFGTFFLNLFTEDSNVSKSERKVLQKFPSLSIETILNKKFMNEFETYTADQFVGRDAYRKLKAYVVYNIFRHSDNNDIYIENGHASKFASKLNDASINSTIKGYNYLRENLLKDNKNVYFSIIPDKNYFIAAQNGYPSIDYNALVNRYNSELSDFQYIDLFNILSIDDYYTTDIHWKQEKINKVVDKLASEMDFVSKDIDYNENVLDGFYGVYYGQSALPLNSEKLIFLTSDELKDITVKVLNEKNAAMGKVTFDVTNLYDDAKFTGNDPYDVYLHGPKQLIVIENPNANTDKELVIFRDSFSSSLAPLLVQSYSKITLIDLRYIANSLLTDEMVNLGLDNQDILILNSIDVLNSGTLRFFNEKHQLIK